MRSAGNLGDPFSIHKQTLAVYTTRSKVPQIESLG